MKHLIIGLAVAIMMFSAAVCVSSIESSEDVEAASGDVVSVNGIGYGTLDEAIKSIASQGTIIVRADITVSSTITIPEGKTISLDMAKHTITGDGSLGGKLFLIEGTLAVTGNGTMKASEDASGWNMFDNYGSLTIQNGTFEGEVRSGVKSNVIKAYDGSTTTIYGGDFTGSPCCIRNEGTVKVYGGTFYSAACSTCNSNWWSYCIINNGAMTFYNGTVTATQGAMAASAGFTEIYNGRFITQDCAKGHGAAFYALYVAGEFGVTSCLVHNGEFTSYNRSTVYVGNSADGGMEESASLVVNGGSFSIANNSSANIIYMDRGTAKIPSASIRGGTYDRAVSSSIIASEHSLVENDDGTYSVKSDKGTDIDHSGYDGEYIAEDSSITLDSSGVKGATVTAVFPEGITLDITGDFSSGSHTISAYPLDKSGYAFDYALAYEISTPTITVDSITVSVPYTEDIGNKSVSATVYRYADGVLEKIGPATYSNGVLTFTTSQNSEYYIDVTLTDPILPDYDDDDYVPPYVVPTKTKDNGDDDSEKVLACAAAAVVAALMAAFLVIDKKR